MKAITVTRFPGPRVLQLREVAKPSPKNSEVLIHVHAAAVNPTDPVHSAGEPSAAGTKSGTTKGKYTIPGDSLAGEIKAVGRDARSFKIGDRVFGNTGLKLGAHAEYICLPDHGALARVPVNMSLDEAAAIVDGGLTAVTFLRDRVRIENGQQVLIHGASGSIGTFAVQLAKYYGAQVTGVCSTANVELVRSLGADMVLDYTKEDFTQARQMYDVIFDTVAKRSFADCRQALRDGGTYLTTFPSPAVLLRRLWPSRAGSKKAVFAAAGLRPFREKAEVLNFIAGLVQAGKLKAVIDRRYALEDAVEAYRYVGRGHKKGNVVLTMPDSSRIPVQP